MKKWIFWVILLAVFTAGCSPKEEMVEQPEKKILKFYVRAISKDSVTGKLVEDYNKLQDDVQIDFDVFGENYRNVVSIGLLSNDPPDIFELNGGLTVEELAMSDYIIPLDDYVDDGLKAQFYEDIFTQDQFYYEGQLYTIPERLANFKLFYNRSLFRMAGLDSEKGPSSLEEMISYAKIITEAGEGQYYGYGLPLKTKSTFNRYFDNIAVLSGISGNSAYDWEKGVYDFEAYTPIVKTMMTMKHQGSLYPNPMSLDVEVARALFAEGKFAMMIDGCWMPAIYNNGEIPNDQDWAVADIPIFEGAAREKGYMTYDMGKVISASCDYPDDAWAFISYLIDNQEAYVEEGEPLRTKISTNDPSIFPEEHIGYEEFSDVDRYRTFPRDTAGLKISSDRSRYEIYKSIFLGETDPSEGLSELSLMYNEALKQQFDP